MCSRKQLTLAWWETPLVTALVAKNLAAHTRRNRKTVLMYGISVGLIIFVSSIAESQYSSFMLSMNWP